MPISWTTVLVRFEGFDRSHFRHADAICAVVAESDRCSCGYASRPGSAPETPGLPVAHRPQLSAYDSSPWNTDDAAVSTFFQPVDCFTNESSSDPSTKLSACAASAAAR